MLTISRIRSSVLCALSLLLAHPFASATIYQYRVSAPKVRAAVVQAAPSHVYATWDAANSGTTYSISDLTLTHAVTTGTSGAARASVNISAGKWYWEMRRDAAAFSQAIGIASTTVDSRTAVWAYNTSSQAYRYVYGYTNGYASVVPSVSTRLTARGGDVIGFALDMDAGTLTVYENCSATAYAIWSGISGTVYPIVTTGGGTLGSKVTANFGATPLECAAPAGYNQGVW